jgi:hypothetical protein
MALGARRTDVLLLVLRQAAVLTLSGAVLGMTFALLMAASEEHDLRGESIGSADLFCGGCVCDCDGPCGLLRACTQSDQD